MTQAFLASAIGSLREIGTALSSYERSTINLIASDNAFPMDLSDYPPYRGHMIQEGLVGERPFAGARLHDAAEDLASRVACAVFGADHANVQPHSCSQANQAVYHALLQDGDTVLSLGFRSGGHLTHGLKSNFSGQHYRFSFYGVDEHGLIDLAVLDRMATELQPKLIVCGSSSYPRLYDCAALERIAQRVGARLMLDLSHEAGLIAGRAVPNPIRHADVVTMSLDKTLRGPFGGLILCRADLAVAIDKAVHPGTQSSFSVRKITDACAALLLTQTHAFTSYARSTINNSQRLAGLLREGGIPLVTDGTDKHYLIADCRPLGLTGSAAEAALEKVGILTNRQTLPTDPSGKTSEAGGLRLGTAWITSRGYGAEDIDVLGDAILRTLRARYSPGSRANLAEVVQALVSRRRDQDVWG